jgi:hypothetical protein
MACLLESGTFRLRLLADAFWRIFCWKTAVIGPGRGFQLRKIVENATITHHSGDEIKTIVVVNIK